MNTGAGLAEHGPGFGVSRLVAALRRDGFQVGASEANDATRLMLALGASDPDVTEEALRTRLRPIFCKSRDEQLRFDAIFDEWLQRLRADAASVQRGESHESEEGKESGAETDDKLAPYRVLSRYVLVGVAVIAVGIGYWRFVSQPVEDQGANPVTATNSGVNPIAVASAPRAATEESVDRYVRELRHNSQLRAGWAWLLVLLPAVAFLGVSLPALALSRSRLRRNTEPMYLNPQPLSIAARRLVPPLRQDIQDRLARHLYSSGLDIERIARRPVLDVRGTLESTVRNDGIPKLKFSHSRVHPSYLLLIDVANERDPRGRFFFQWAERMQRQGLDVEMLLVRTTLAPNRDALVEFARVAKHGAPAQAWLPLSRVRSPRFGERLIMISDGRPLVDSDGKWHAAALHARFYRWRDRVVFTPVEPRDWGIREELMERRERPADPGFYVLPLEESALAAWTDLIASGQLSMVELADPQRFPALLRRGEIEEYLRDTPPTAERMEKLIAQLRVYLGEWGFYWFVACAVPPLVRWELTLILGEEVLKGLPQPVRDGDVAQALARYYRRLVKLPWMQREAMPEWLRLRLLMELPESRHEELQKLVSVRLGALGRQPGADGIQLNFERPPGDSDSPVPGPRLDPRGGDVLYLGYVSGLTPEQLVLRAPRQWGAWTGSIRLKAPRGFQGWLARMRDHTSSWWARFAWTNGLPHLGVSRRGIVLTAILAAPLLAMIALAVGAPSGLARFGEGWLLEDRWTPLGVPGPTYRHTFALSSDGSYLATFDFRLDLWDLRTGRKIATQNEAFGFNSNAVAFSQDGAYVAVVATDVGRQSHTLTIFETAAMKLIGRTAGRGSVRALAFSQDGRSVLILASNAIRSFSIQQLSEERVVAELENLGREAPVALSPDGSRLVASTGTGFAEWDVDTGQRLRSWEVAAAGVVRALACVSRCSRFVTAGWNGAIRVWDGNTALQLGPTLVPESGAVNVAVSADGTRIAAHGTGDMTIWNAHAARMARDFGWEPAGASGAVAYSGDGARVATTVAGGGVRIWDALLAKPIKIVGQDLMLPSYLALSRNGDRLIVGAEGRARLWNVDTGRELPVQDPVLGTVFDVAFSPDGTRAAFAGQEGIAFITAEGALQVRDQTAGAIRAIAFNSTGPRVAAAGASGRLHLLHSRGSRLDIEPSYPSSGAVFSVAFNSDGTRVVTGHAGGEITLWDAVNRRMLTRIAGGLDSRVMQIGFVHDDSRILSMDEYSSVRLWDAQTGEQIGSAVTWPGQRSLAVHSDRDEFVTLDSLGQIAAQSQTQQEPAKADETLAPGRQRLAFWRVDPPVAEVVGRWHTERILTDAAELIPRWTDSIYPAVGLAVLVLAAFILAKIARRRAVSRLVTSREQQPT